MHDGLHDQLASGDLGDSAPTRKCCSNQVGTSLSNEINLGPMTMTIALGRIGLKASEGTDQRSSRGAEQGRNQAESEVETN